MFKNYWKVAIRNLVRHKGFSFINIMGLGLGMACAFMIFLWIQNETSYDRFHPNAGNIYRIMSYGTKYFQKGIDGTPAPLAPAIKAELPEVKNVTRLADIPQVAFRRDSHIFFENRGLAVDPSFFEIFSFSFEAGNQNTAFVNPLDIVISKKMAEKYFGKEKALNGILEIEGHPIRIAGILENTPSNSHIQFDHLFSFEGMKKLASWGTHWGAFNFVTYIELQPGADVESTARKITAIAERNNCPQVKDGVRFQLQPLLDIHMDGRGSYRNYYDLIDGKYVTIFSIIAALVLLIACFNFMNLSTARSASRSNEVGIRKTVGANRVQLTWQFLGETFMMSFLSLGLALLMVQLFLPVLNRISSRDLSLNLLDWGQFLGIIAITFLTGMIAGFYPSLFLSRHTPKHIFSGISGKRGRSSRLRKVFVVTQFTVTIILITTTVFLYKQMQFIQKRNLGFNKDHIICLPLKGDMGKKYSVVKADLMMDPVIKDVTAVHYFFPILNPRTTDYNWEGKSPGFQVDMMINVVGDDFFRTLGIKVIQGRSFSSQFSTDEDQSYMVNEEAVAAMGISNPVGKSFSYAGKEGTIIGVFKNAHFKSLHHKIESHVFMLSNDHSEASQYGAILIKTTGQNTEKAMATVKNVWEKINPNIPFEPHFMDQVYEKLYLNEKRVRLILNHFTFLTLFISCLGLFGLATFITERLSKEIGIRKVLGATLGQIISRLSLDFIKWIGIAFILAVPVSYLIVNQMLKIYAYRTSISIGLFAFSGILILLSALLTVSYHSIKAATANPVESLRVE